MKAKAAFYFLILCRQFLSLGRYRRKKGVEVKLHCRTWGVLRYIKSSKKSASLNIYVHSTAFSPWRASPWWTRRRPPARPAWAQSWARPCSGRGSSGGTPFSLSSVTRLLSSPRSQSQSGLKRPPIRSTGDQEFLLNLKCFFRTV